MSSTLLNQSRSIENQFDSKNPDTLADHSRVSLENRPHSRTVKTILMIAAFAGLACFLLVKSGILLRGYTKPVLIDMPKTLYPYHWHFFKKEPVLSVAIFQACNPVSP